MGNFGEATTVILTLSMRVRCAYVCPSREYSLRVVFSVRRADVSGVVWRRVTCSRVCVRAEWPWASVRVRGTLRLRCMHWVHAAAQRARTREAVRSPLPAAPREVCPRRIPITARNVIRVYAACRVRLAKASRRFSRTPREVRRLRIDEKCPRASRASPRSPRRVRAPAGRSLGDRCH